jgi:hypothetical protein
MRRLALILTMAVRVALPASALAGGALPGTYTTKIAKAGRFKGTWTLTFAKAGTYTAALNGAVLVTGKYTTSGAKVTLGHETGPRVLLAARQVLLEAHGQGARVHQGQRFPVGVSGSHLRARTRLHAAGLRRRASPAADLRSAPAWGIHSRL